MAGHKLFPTICPILAHQCLTILTLGSVLDTAASTLRSSPSTSISNLVTGYSTVSPWAHLMVIASPSRYCPSWTRFSLTIVLLQPVSNTMLLTVLSSIWPLRHTEEALLTDNCCCSPLQNIFVTEFRKITHMGACEIFRIFKFGELLIRAGHSFENISKFFL